MSNYNSHETSSASELSQPDDMPEAVASPCENEEIDFMAVLVRPVPYDYKLKRLRPKRAANEMLAFEMDDSHRFRNSVAFAKTGQSTLQSLSGGRSSTMREYMKKRGREKQISEQYKRCFPIMLNRPVEFPLDVVGWEAQAEQIAAEADRCPASSVDSFGNSEERFEDAISENRDGYERVTEEEDDGWEGTLVNKDSPGPTDSAQTRERSFQGLPSCAAAVMTREYVNNLLAQNWEENVIVEDAELANERLTLYIDDPNLIFERVEEKKRGKGKRKCALDRSGRNKYNISNDKYYASEGKKASLGAFGVQHSAVALRLDERFYRANPSRDELLNFHRPSIGLANGEYRFQEAAHQRKRQEGSRRPGELSLGDQTPFQLIEYAEEHPFFIVNPGMVSLLNNYYRTSETGDEPFPNGCIALESGEDSPFYGFGDLRPGMSIQAVANNLFIAPVATHNTPGLFICICLENSLVFRPVDSLLLAGQQLPKEEVFAPHSRRLNQFCKDRLKVAAHRAFSKGRNLLMSDLDRLFPYFSEGSKRKWLKEYADCVKMGRDNVWVLRDPHPILAEEDLRKLVTPEDICQYESMLACETRMQEMGIRCPEGDNDDHQQFVPNWVLSKNFVNAANGRGLLQIVQKEINSDFEAAFFSFRRIRLKKGNEAENRRILVEHQASYKERIDRVWAKQIEFISASTAPSLEKSLREEKHQDPKAEEARAQPKKVEAEVKPKSKAEGGQRGSAPAMITIKRTFREGGKIVVKTQQLTDPKLIQAYLKARKKISPEKKGSLTCSNCGQTGHMKTNKGCPNYISSTRISKKKADSERKKAKTVLQDMMNKLLAKFIAIPYSNAFHRPVSHKKFPNYPLIVKSPMDFHTVKMNVRASKYKRFSEFVAEFRLILDNCILYNGPTHSLTEIAENIYNQATEFEKEHQKEIEEAEELANNE